MATNSLGDGRTVPGGADAIGIGAVAAGRGGGPTGEAGIAAAGGGGADAVAVTGRFVQPDRIAAATSSVIVVAMPVDCGFIACLVCSYRRFRRWRNTHARGEGISLCL